MATDITPPTSADDKPPNLKDSLWKIVISCCKGRRRLAILVFVILSLAIGLWWHWDKVRQLPGIEAIVKWASQDSLPKADPKRFAVVLAHIEGDQNCQFEKLIVDALKEFEGIQVLRLDRLIPLEGAYPEETEKSGRKRSREYLQKIGAQVLIWGTVVKTPEKGVPKLYWTSLIDSKPPKRYGRYQPTEDFGLPSIFWEDLMDVLRLVIFTQDVEFRGYRGQFVADRMKPFTEKVSQLVRGGEGKPGWNQQTLTQVWSILGFSLKILGEQSGDNHILEEAVAAYREALKGLTSDHDPLQWAQMYNGLGMIFPQNNGHTERLGYYNKLGGVYGRGKKKVRQGI
jgi:hypothetical protein